MRIQNSSNKLLIWIIVLLLVLGGMAYYGNKMSSGIECLVDADCVPNECCHPTSCVVDGQQENCAAVLCTANCEPGTLDCGQGSCLCVKGFCRTEINGVLQ